MTDMLYISQYMWYINTVYQFKIRRPLSMSEIQLHIRSRLMLMKKHKSTGGICGNLCKLECIYD